MLKLSHLVLMVTHHKTILGAVRLASGGKTKWSHPVSIPADQCDPSKTENS